MSHYTWLGALAALLSFLTAFFVIKPKTPRETPMKPPTAPPAPATPPSSPAPANATVAPPTALFFATPKEAYHATRVLCDEAGLTFAEKNIICACVYQESNFFTHPKPNQNKDPKTGQVWSTDYGIVQINDHFHIGPGKDFPSVDYVLTRPEMCIAWMIAMFKAGRLSQWSSYSTGAYKQWLVPNSPMWTLAA